MSLTISDPLVHPHALIANDASYLKHLLRFLDGNNDYSLHFQIDLCPDQNSIVPHVDANCGECQETRRSTAVFIDAENDAPVFWRVISSLSLNSLF